MVSLFKIEPIKINENILLNKFIKYIALLILPLSLLMQNLSAQREFVYFPKAIPAWDISHTAGISLAILPRAIVEEEIRQVPVLDYQLRLGLPYNFSINTRVSAVYIANQASIGLQWSYSYDDFSFSIGDNTAYWYGFADIDGFDIVATGWMNYPFISIGADLEEVYLTIKAEMLIITNQNTSVGETSLYNQRNKMAGYAVSFAIEQPFWKDNDFLLAVRLNYATFMYQSWLAVSTSDNKRMFPEFIIGFIL